MGKPDDQGYPVRGIVRGEYLHLINFKPDRWPAGNPETGYLNCDGSPTKTLILSLNRSGESSLYWNLNFGKRSEEELYNLTEDPECLMNLADNPDHQALKTGLKTQLLHELEDQEDLRVFGRGDIFDTYEYADESTRDFYNRFMCGEIHADQAGWVNITDFETAVKKQK